MAARSGTWTARILIGRVVGQLPFERRKGGRAGASIACDFRLAASGTDTRTGRGFTGTVPDSVGRFRVTGDDPRLCEWKLFLQLVYAGPLAAWVCEFRSTLSCQINQTRNLTQLSRVKLIQLLLDATYTIPRVSLHHTCAWHHHHRIQLL